MGRLWLVIPAQTYLLDGNFNRADWGDGDWGFVEEAFEDVVNDKVAHAIRRLVED